MPPPTYKPLPPATNAERQRAFRARNPGYRERFRYKDGPPVAWRAAAAAASPAKGQPTPAKGQPTPAARQATVVVGQGCDGEGI